MKQHELQKKMLEYRARNNISQGELARRANVSVMTVNAVENGTQTPSKLTEMKLRMVVESDER